MSLDQVIGGLLGKAGGGGAKSAAIAAAVPVVTQLLKGGGLSKLLQGFQANGLGEQADSWVAKGQNKPISAADVDKVLGKEHVARVAQQANIPEGEAADVLAQAIPAAVDHVTPQGHVPDSADVDTALEQPATY